MQRELRPYEQEPPEADELVPAGAPMGRSLWANAWRKLAHDRGAMVCLAAVVLYSLVAIAAAGYDFYAHREGIVPYYARPHPELSNEPPSLHHWDDILGRDWNGRSVLVRTIMGAKVSMTVGLLTNLIAVPLGILLGTMAGYFGGRVDDVIVWVYTTLMAVPGIILLIAMKYAFQGVTVLGLDLTGIYGVIIALGVTSWISTCRLVRAETFKVRELDYVLAARATGAGRLSILFRHVMPNVMHLGIINFSLGFVGAVQAEVILSYLGLGVKVGTPSWGSMINGARLNLFAGRWWELTSAVVALFILVLALNILGDRLRDALDPRLRGL